MRALFFLSLIWLFISPVLAQESSSRSVDFPAPQGWKSETISLPPDFAPDMGWAGVEVLKFSPAMFKAQDKDFFSYVFLLQLDSGDPDWESELMNYYTGLAKTVMKDPGLDVSNFRVELLPGDSTSHGKIWWTEPFKTRKPQILNFELTKLGADRWFVCVSPTSPRSSVWTTMRRMRNALLTQG